MPTLLTTVRGEVTLVVPKYEMFRLKDYAKPFHYRGRRRLPMKGDRVSLLVDARHDVYDLKKVKDRVRNDEI